MTIPDPNAEVRVLALRSYYHRVHGALRQAGHPQGLYGYQARPLADPWADEPEPLAEATLGIIRALGIKAPAGWAR